MSIGELSDARLGIPTLTLSPPPKSRLLAGVTFVVSLVVFLGIASLASGGLASALRGTTAAWVAWLLVILGVAFALAPVILSVRAVAQSFRADRLARDGDILTARADASRSRELALFAIGVQVAVVVLVALFALIFSNNASVQQTFLRWDIIGGSWAAVMQAFGLNLLIAVCAEIIVLVFGLVLAVARLAPGRAGAPIRWLAVAYIDALRAVPAIIVIYLVGFGLPLAGVPLFKDMSPTWFAVIALGLTYSAYVAETYRSGIESIHASQFSASRSLGFSYAQTMRYVILPQAVRVVIPPLLTMFIGLQKDTALVNIIGAMDAFNTAKYVSSTQYNLSAVTIVAILFIVITIPQTRFVDWWLERGKKARKGA